MAFQVRLGVRTTEGHIYISEETGDYSISNPGGWDGGGNPSRGDIESTTFVIIGPDGTTYNQVIDTNTFLKASPYLTDLATPLSGDAITPADGVYQLTVTYADTDPIPNDTWTGGVNILYDYSVRCALGKLALGDVTKTKYAELKLEYDRMVQAFECEDFVLTAEILADINDMLTGCGGSLNCDCGC